MMRHARCIAIEYGWRCPRRAGKRAGDIFVCSQHAGLISMAVLSDWLSPPTRRMLAHARWSTAREGQQWIDRMYAKRAA